MEGLDKRNIYIVTFILFGSVNWCVAQHIFVIIWEEVDIDEL